MKLKILILPFFIIIELVFIIGYIKPNYDAITTKQSEITLQKDALSRVDSVAENIGAIHQALENRSDIVNFIDRYYPKSLDEERVVDMFNYLAQQSGIVVSEVKIKKNVKSQVVAVESPLPVVEDETMGVSVVATEAPEEPAESYEVTVSVLGAYQNLKDFFTRVYRSDRLHFTKEFSIMVREVDVEQAEKEATQGIQSNFLSASVVVDFDYIKEKRVANALNIPMFQSSDFDFKDAEEAKTFVTNLLPPVQSDEVGKANPFE